MMADKNGYEDTLRELQIELVRFQRDLIAQNKRILVIIEGRDGAGKDGTIKRLTEHMSPRETRIVALSKPSDREVTQWYFQRFVPHLPAAGEFVIFNRSWYNRAGVEPVMGFCTKEETAAFLKDVPVFEAMLRHSGIHLIKYYLDISRKEQKKRMAERRRDPLKQWKISPIDQKAVAKFDAYSQARDEMLPATSHPDCPWVIVRADDKKTARLNLIRDLLSRCDYDGKNQKMARPDRDIVFAWSKRDHARLAR